MKIARKIKRLLFLLLFLILLVPYGKSYTDSNLSNNNKTVYINVVKTRTLDILYMPIDDRKNLRSNIDDVEDFIKITYPLASFTGVNSYVANITLSSYNYQSDDGVISLLKELKGAYLKSKSIFERVIGILPHGWFGNYTVAHQNATGLSFRRRFIRSKDSVLIEKGYRTVAAHEVAHTYRVCDEYTLNSWNDQNNFQKIFFGGGCPNKYNDNNCRDGCSVSPITDTYPGLNPWSSGPYSNFMGAVTPQDTRWVSNETYNYLLNEFKHNTPINVSNRILISGVYNNTSDTITFDYFYEIGDGEAENTSEFANGNYSISLLDNSLNTMVNISFNMTYEPWSEGDTNENLTYFVYILEFPNSTLKIRIYENGVIKDEVTVSAHAPTVNITYPNSSAIYRDPFNITWNGYDSDGDTLYYAISLSYDNGTSYSTIELDYNSSYYTIDPNNFLCGSNYKAEVMVTDGIRTNTSQTFYNFSLVPDPSVEVEEINVIYMNNTKVVYEIKAINDGCDPVDNLSWSFNLGDGTILNSSYKASLQYNEELLLYFEYNYALGGQKTVNFSISNGSVSDSLAYSFEIPNLNITNYSIMHSDRSHVILEYKVKNELPYRVENVSWRINTGQNTITSYYNIALESGEDIFIYIQEDYNGYNTYNIVFNASDGINNKTVSLMYDYREIDVYNLTTLYQNSTTKESISEFSIRSLEDLNKNVSWKFNTGEIMLNSTMNSTINMTDSIMVFIKYNYSQTGAYEATAQGLTNISNDSASTIVII